MTPPAPRRTVSLRDRPGVQARWQKKRLPPEADEYSLGQGGALSAAVKPLDPGALDPETTAQSAATSRAYAIRYQERLSENVDWLGLGLANLDAAFSATFVVNGSPTKTQVVDSAGGRSQVAQLTTSLIVLLVLLFLTGPLAYLPGAALSTMVFLIGVELIDIKGLRTIRAQSPTEFWVALMTAMVVVAVGVEQGILLAMALSLADHVRRSYRPKNVVVAAYQTGGWRLAPLTAPEQIRPGLLVYRFTHSMYYANSD